MSGFNKVKQDLWAINCFCINVDLKCEGCLESINRLVLAWQWEGLKPAFWYQNVITVSMHLL